MIEKKTNLKHGSINIAFFDSLSKNIIIPVSCILVSRTWVSHIPHKVFKNGSSKICHIISNFLKAVFHKFFLVHSWIHWPISYFRALEFKNISKKNLVGFAEHKILE